MALFEIVEVLDKDNVRPLPDFGLFPDGKIAASVIPSLSATRPGVKLQPRPVKDKADWRERERKRIAEGKYELLTFEGLDLHPDHFVRRFKDTKDQIQYFHSSAAGELDRLTTLHINRYIYNHYSISEELRRKLVWGFTGYDPAKALTITSDADEIEKVYTNGPDSCMGYPADSYACDPVHPSYAYSGPDLALAYIRDEEDRVTGRTVVWPDKKIFGRMYGDSVQLRQALEAEGYAEYWWGFQGARLRTQPASGDYDDSYFEGYIAPYVDVGSYGVLDEQNQVFIIDDTHGSHSLNYTSGVVDVGDEEASHECCGCGERHPEHGMIYIGRAAKRGRYCEKCAVPLGWQLVNGFWNEASDDEIEQLADGTKVFKRYAAESVVVCPETGKRINKNRAAIVDGIHYSWEGLLKLRERCA